MQKRFTEKANKKKRTKKKKTRHQSDFPSSSTLTLMMIWIWKIMKRINSASYVGKRESLTRGNSASTASSGLVLSVSRCDKDPINATFVFKCILFFVSPQSFQVILKFLGIFNYLLIRFLSISQVSGLFVILPRPFVILTHGWGKITKITFFGKTHSMSLKS